MSVDSVSGRRFEILFQDGGTSFIEIYFVRQKSEFLDCLRGFNENLKNQFGCSLQVLHTDNGAEIVSQDVQDYLRKIGAKHETTVPYPPGQNGRSERELSTIMKNRKSNVACEESSVIPLG